jgi:hypothetical protein
MRSVVEVIVTGKPELAEALAVKLLVGVTD